MHVTRKSMTSGKTHTLDIPVDPAKLRDWEAGKLGRQLIQDVFPELSADQREFLMTGTTAEEWKELFGDGDD